jgi:hypothetical protein
MLSRNVDSVYLNSSFLTIRLEVYILSVNVCFFVFFPNARSKMWYVACVQYEVRCVLSMGEKRRHDSYT